MDRRAQKPGSEPPTPAVTNRQPVTRSVTVFFKLPGTGPAPSLRVLGPGQRHPAAKRADRAKKIGPAKRGFPRALFLYLGES